MAPYKVDAGFVSKVNQSSVNSILGEMHRRWVVCISLGPRDYLCFGFIPCTVSLRPLSCQMTLWRSLPLLREKLSVYQKCSRTNVGKNIYNIRDLVKLQIWLQIEFLFSFFILRFLTINKWKVIFFHLFLNQHTCEISLWYCNQSVFLLFLFSVSPALVIFVFLW